MIVEDVIAAIVIVSNLIACLRQTSNAAALLRRYRAHKRDGKNGAMKLLLVKRIMLATLFATFSFAWCAVTLAYVLTAHFDRDRLELLRNLSALLFIAWAISTVIYGEADAWLQDRIEDDLDRQEHETAMLQAEHDALVAATQEDALSE